VLFVLRAPAGLNVRGSLVPVGGPVASFFVARTPLASHSTSCSRLTKGSGACRARGNDATLRGRAHRRPSIRAHSGSKRCWHVPRGSGGPIFSRAPNLLARLQDVGSLEDAGRARARGCEILFRMCAEHHALRLFAAPASRSAPWAPRPRIDLVPLASTRAARASYKRLPVHLGSIGSSAPRRSPRRLRFRPNSSLYRRQDPFATRNPAQREGTLEPSRRRCGDRLPRLDARMGSRRRDDVTARREARGPTDPEIPPQTKPSPSSESSLRARSSCPTSRRRSPKRTARRALSGWLFSLQPAHVRACKECQSAVEALARSPLGVPRERYVSLARQFESHTTRRSRASAFSFHLQVDLVKSQRVRRRARPPSRWPRS
jgi:hypothetical protein